jgi:hypothetical protein
MDKYKEVDENDLLFDIYIFMATPTPTPTPTITPTPSVPYNGLQKTVFGYQWGENVSALETDPKYVPIMPRVPEDGVLTLPLPENTPGYSVQWLGYFTPQTSETYTFYLDADDLSMLWIGDSAINDYYTPQGFAKNVLVDDGINAGSPDRERSGSIFLTAGVAYPLRIQFSQDAGTSHFTASFSTDTITKTSDFTGLISYAPFPTPTLTSTPTITPTLTSTPTLTPTKTLTPTPTPTLTSTPVPSSTSTPTPTPTPTPAISNQRPSKPTCSKPNTLPLIPYKIQIKHGGIPASNWNISWEVIQKDSGTVLYSGSFDKDKVVVDLIDENNYLSATTSDKKGIYLPNTRFRTYSYILL